MLTRPWQTTTLEYVIISFHTFSSSANLNPQTTALSAALALGGVRSRLHSVLDYITDETPAQFFWFLVLQYHDKTPDWWGNGERPLSSSPRASLTIRVSQLLLDRGVTRRLAVLGCPCQTSDTLAPRECDPIATPLTSADARLSLDRGGIRAKTGLDDPPVYNRSTPGHHCTVDRTAARADSAPRHPSPSHKRHLQSAMSNGKVPSSESVPDAGAYIA